MIISIKSCDAIVIISPIVFGTLTGGVIDFAAKYIGLTEKLRLKKGAAIIVDNNISDENRDNIGRTTELIMNCFNATGKIAVTVVSRENYSSIQQVANRLNLNMDNENLEKGQLSGVYKSSSPQDKIRLFRSLFMGREDVYALRWYNA